MGNVVWWWSSCSCRRFCFVVFLECFSNESGLKICHWSIPYRFHILDSQRIQKDSAKEMEKQFLVQLQWFSYMFCGNDHRIRPVCCAHVLIVFCTVEWFHFQLWCFSAFPVGFLTFLCNVVSLCPLTVHLTSVCPISYVTLGFSFLFQLTVPHIFVFYGTNHIVWGSKYQLFTHRVFPLFRYLAISVSTTAPEMLISRCGMMSVVLTI
jgi:hypothetical protein